MITDKDIAEAEIIVNAIKAGRSVKDIAFRVSEVRTESVEQAMKEAAERAADWYKESCLNEYCPSCTAPNCSTIDSLRTAVLSTVKESFTVAHVSTDTEKLAVARRALKVIQSVEHDSSSITYRECMNALRETE